MAKLEELADEWEHVESPKSLRLPPAPPLKQHTSAVTRGNYLPVSESSGVFPPAHHEGHDSGVHPFPNLIPLSPSSPLSSVSSSSPEAAPSGNVHSGESGGEGKTGPGGGIWGIVWRAWYRLWFGVSVWKLVSAAGILGAAMAATLYVRKMVWRRRQQVLRRVAIGEENKNHLIHLIKEKDQRIQQLQLQIARLNEMVLARRHVPVVRVG